MKEKLPHSSTSCVTDVFPEWGDYVFELCNGHERWYADEQV